MGNLRQRLSDAVHDVGVDKPSNQMSYCALEYGKDCCDGRGYLVTPKGPYLRASVCGCTSSCLNCMGKMYRVDNNGESRPCKKPLPSVIVNLYNDAQIPARYLDSKINSFLNFTGNGQTLVSNLNNYVDNFKKNEQQGLVISGPVGVGKTYLLAALAKEILSKGYSAKFVDFFQLLAEIKASFSKKESEDSILQPLIDVDVLLIDELGKGRNTEFELTIIDQIVMGRYNQDKPIIATTNYLFKDQSNQHTFNVDLTQAQDNGTSKFSPDVFGTLKNRVGSRIFSRLEESCHFAELTGDDYRKMKAQSRGYEFK